MFICLSPLPAGLDERALARLAKVIMKRLRMTSLSAGLRCVSLSEMRSLNRTFRRRNRPTDVLSFASQEPGYLGDLVLCPAYARQEAKRRGLPAREEYLRLVIHGVLHLKGYDHASAEEEVRMFKLQEDLLERMEP